MTTFEITLWHVYATSLTMSVSTMHFHIEIMFNLKAINPIFFVQTASAPNIKPTNRTDPSKTIENWLG